MDNQAGPSTSTRKRSRSDSEDSGYKAVKRSRYTFWKWLNNQNLEELSDEDGSELSFQNHETDEPHDTTCEDISSESSHGVDVEYECVSDSNHESLHSDISTGDDDNIAAGAITAILCSGGDTITDCDEDSDNSSVERVAVDSTKWQLCIQCNGKNDNPLYRFCHDCYKKRKELFPPHPRGFKKRDSLKVKVKKCKSKVGSQDSGNGSFNLNAEAIEPDTKNSERLKLDCTVIVRNNNIPMSNFNNNRHDIPVPNSILNQESAGASNQSVTGENNEIKAKELNFDLLKKKAPSFAVTKELCMICATVTKDSIFLHGTTGHLACCYQCSIKTWKTTKCCPVCKAKVRNVVKIYS